MPPRKKLSDELSSSGRTRGPRQDPEIARERRQLTSRAQSLALSVLRERHRDEYNKLYEQAKDEVGLNFKYEE